MKVDNDFKNLLPELTSEEYTGLERDIVKHGILSPIILWNDTIVDGHNRYRIAQAHRFSDSAIPTKEIQFDSKAKAIEWIINNQKSRRNLTKSQLVDAWSKWETERAREAAERKKGGQGGVLLGKNFNEANDHIRTAAEVAAKIGVSEPTYRDMKLIKEQGTEEQIARMDKGGKGNGVSAIAREIKGANKCRDCGTELTEENTFASDYKRHVYLCKECRTRRVHTPDNKYENMLIENDKNYHMNFQDLEDEIVNIVSSAMDSVFSSLNNYKQQGISATEKSIENIREMFSMLIATMKEMEEQNA